MIRIATRGSLLALWQAGHVESALIAAGYGGRTHLEPVSTIGDRVADVPLSAIGGRGLFTREVDEAVLSGRADCAVHSLKDVPTQLADGLAVAAVLERADPRDAWLARDAVSTLGNLSTGSRVGTSSLRRRALLLAQRPDLDVADIRGNLDTRLDKLQSGDYDAIVLAHAGLLRLGRAHEVTCVLAVPEWLPAPGQGAIAVVARASDIYTLAALQPLDHAATRAAVTAERALLRHLEGGCQVPIGALASVDGGEVRIDAVVADPDGVTVLRASGSAAVIDAARLGVDVAQQLIADGADRILERLRNLSDAGTRVDHP